MSAVSVVGGNVSCSPSAVAIHELPNINAGSPAASKGPNKRKSRAPVGLLVQPVAVCSGLRRIAGGVGSLQERVLSVDSTHFGTTEESCEEVHCGGGMDEVVKKARKGRW